MKTTVAVAALFACLVGTAILKAQQPANGPLLSDQVFKNVQVMKGIPVDQFMATMGFFSASLGMSCEDCHMADDRDWSGFAADNARKRRARQMIQMMQKINADNFGGRQMVTCYSCHRGQDAPRTVPDFAIQYGPLQPADPNAIVVQNPLSPMPDAVFNKYLQAVGGAEKAAALTSYTATGTNVGYGPESVDKRQSEIYAKANPLQRTTIVHTSNGPATTTLNGTNAWYAAPLRPVDVLTLAGQELAGAKIDAMLFFPAQVKAIAPRWRVGTPTTIDDQDVDVVQGNTSDGIIVSLYFDQKTGLLTRSIRYTDSPVGKLPVQVDYADYRDVNGVKMPFKYTQTGLDGRDTFELTQIRANVNVEASRFNKPAPVAPPKK
ncbi:MAG TPA: photosynthetic reaction center cytochrome c subunit family protein [Vicinamibacterales bacterium]|jgi:photosynthetic reaction center cytochrome c subunit|nr:photosynthetic reaction center cytochrome c subunit family protein [Vicinamibacterales bacterium]